MSNPPWDRVLIQTKFHRPTLPVDLVARSHLTNWLDERINSPITLVSAPAGYGKSTLISSWLDTCKYPHTWLTLDAGDNDLIRFLTYFLEAIRIIFPETVQKTQTLLTAQTQPPVKEFVINLINDINQLDEFFVLVLDDYEVIQNTAIHDFINDFLLHPLQDFHLVLCSRIDPPLSIQKLRAQNKLTEIRAQDLRFSVEESYRFLKNILGATVDMATAEELDQQSEGWVTGLRLSALALRHRVGKQQIDVKPTVNNKYVSDYLMAEILDSQRVVYAEWLLKTSILARFNADLCEAVCLDESLGSYQSEGAPALDGEGFLKWLVSSNLFSTPLDDHNRWVRYHHLFRDFLQTELADRYDQTAISDLHNKASEWFAEQGQVDEALHHALEAKELSAAAQLVEQNARTAIDSDQWYLLEKWIAQLPDSVIYERPLLMLAKAWMLFYHFALRDIPPLLETVETILDDDKAAQPLWGEIDFFWGHHWFWQGQIDHSLALFERALERIPKSFQVARGHAELFWGVANQMAGRKKEAILALKKWLHYEQIPHPIRQARLEGALIFIHFLAGELVEADQMAHNFLAAATKSKNAYATAWGSYLCGMVNYLWNDMEKAVHYFALAVEMRYNLHARAAIDSLAGLTLTYQALGHPDRAEATMALLLEFAQDTIDPVYISVAHSCQARLALSQGDQAFAVRWLQTSDLINDAGVMFYWIELSQITQCRVLIAEGTKTSLEEAMDLLQAYRQQNEDQHNIRQLIDILLLQVLIYNKQSKADQALATLAYVITLAEPGGWIWPFVEVGPELLPVLTLLIDQQGESEYIRKILAALKTGGDSDEGIPMISSPKLIEPLTNRESEILALLGERLTNKEIAAELHISVGTVQQHLNHIYAKLDVKGRRQAVTKATELDLFPIYK